MLCKRPSNLRIIPTAIHCRYNSSQSVSPYSLPNLRAFPFRYSPHDAERHLSPFGSLIRTEKAFSATMARFFPFLGFQPIKPARLIPVYFPGWILDVEVKATVTLKGNEREAYAQIHNAYLPGSDYKVLSSAPLVPMVSTARETIPFSQDLMRQHGVDVACIPYNISPFSLIDITRRLSLFEGKISQDLSFNPSSVEPSLFAAYPVLIPVYLAQYEYNTASGTRYHTCFMEAYGIDSNYWCEPLTDHHSRERDFLSFVRSFFPLPEGNSPLVLNLGYPKRFVETVGFSHTPHQEVGHALRDYLERAVNLPNAPADLAAASVGKMSELHEDPRIREFSHQEMTPTIEWLKLGSELMMVNRMYEAMLKAREGSEVAAKGSMTNSRGAVTLFDGAVTHLKEKKALLEAERRKIKPSWARTKSDLEEEADVRTESTESNDSRSS